MKRGHLLCSNTETKTRPHPCWNLNSSAVYPHVTSLIAKPRFSHNDRPPASILPLWALSRGSVSITTSHTSPPVSCSSQIALDRCCPPVVVRDFFFSTEKRRPEEFSFAFVDSFDCPPTTTLPRRYPQGVRCSSCRLHRISSPRMFSRYVVMVWVGMLLRGKSL